MTRKPTQEQGQRQAWLENRHPEQLVVDLAMIEWAARDLETRGRGGIEFVLHGVRLGDRYWDAIRFKHWIRKDRGERQIQMKSNDCSPECVSTYNKSRVNREGQKRFAEALFAEMMMVTDGWIQPNGC